MRNLIVTGFLALFSLSACQTSKWSYYADDVYSVPEEERRIALAAAQEKTKQETEAKQKEQQALAEQKAKDDANPYYQDPSYSGDDYYDYQYASRLRRFGNPIGGAGYYDNYYTNYYHYNQDPSCYGSSIYNSYNWCGGPSNNYYGNTFGISYQYPYNPYYAGYNAGYYNGYNSGYYNGYYGYPYNTYSYNNWNYYNGYGNQYNNNWGYLNSYDVNSQYSLYAMRGSFVGGNSSRKTFAGMAVPEELREQPLIRYFESVAELQKTSVRFDENLRKKITEQNNNPVKQGFSTGLNNPSPNGAGDKSYTRDRNTATDTETSNTGRNSGWNAWPKNTGSDQNISNGQNGSATKSESSRHRNYSSGTDQPVKTDTPKNNGRNTENNQSGWSFPSNNGGSSGSQSSGESSGGGRNSGGGGGGGTTRPR